MEKQPEQGMSKQILEELKVIEFIAGKIREQVKIMREVITQGGDPEQNVKDNTLLIYGIADNVSDVYNIEFRYSAHRIVSVIWNILYQKIGIEKNEKGSLRHLVPPHKPDATPETDA